MNGDYECKGERMKKCLEQVKKRVGDHQTKFVQIPKEENEQANRLANAALAEHMLIPSNVLSFIQLSPQINGMDVQEIGSQDNWTTLIVLYLRDSTLLDSKEAAMKLIVQVA